MNKKLLIIPLALHIVAAIALVNINKDEKPMYKPVQGTQPISTTVHTMQEEVATEPIVVVDEQKKAPQAPKTTVDQPINQPVAETPKVDEPQAPTSIVAPQGGTTMHVVPIDNRNRQ